MLIPGTLDQPLLAAVPIVEAVTSVLFEYVYPVALDEALYVELSATPE